MIAVLEHGRVRELRLSRPPVNALNPALLEALRAALAQAPRDGAGAVVLSGAPGCFSAGLDVPELLQLERAALRRTWETFFALLRDIAEAPIPVVAALTGHSPAGGAVLAIFTDYRVLAEGPFLIGLNEVQVGLPVPETVFGALVHVVGARQAERLAVGGRLLAPPEALRCGLVDEVVPAAEVVPRAVAWATELVARPAAAMAATRQLARRPVREAFATVDARAIDELVERWFSVETQAVLRALVAGLGKKR